MAFDKKRLSLIHIEAGSKLFENMDKPDSHRMIVATYLATPKVLDKARTDEAALASVLELADEMDAEDAQGIVTDFFEQWGKYQTSILNCVTESGMVKAAQEVAERTKLAMTPKVTVISEPSAISEAIPE